MTLGPSFDNIIHDPGDILLRALSAEKWWKNGPVVEERP